MSDIRLRAVVVFCAILFLWMVSMQMTEAAKSSMSRPAKLIERKGTRLLLDDKPFRELSFNKFDLLWQFVFDYEKENGREAALESLDWLRENGFRVIRVSCCPYGADGFREVFFDSDLQIQAQKRTRYFSRFDEMVQACEQRGIQIVATLAWNMAVLDDLGANTFVEGLTNPEAEGRAKIEDYIREVVTRYRGRQGIAMWEIGNEWNLMADLRHKDKPGWDFTANQLGAFYRDIALIIKAYDPWHLVTTGDSSPRQSAWHLYRSSVLKTKQHDWTNDSKDELVEYLKMVNPDPIDVISIHYYDEAMTALGRDVGNVDNIEIYKQLADRVGKPLFIGEVGPHHGFKNAKYTDSRNIDLSRRVIDKVLKCDIPITLFWAFQDDREPFNGTPGDYVLRHGYTDEVLGMITQGQRKLTQP